MFYLHTSNRTESLLTALAEVIQAGDPPSLFGGEVFLVQSRGMELKISQFLAETFGVWTRASYLLPLQFFGYLESLIDDGFQPGSGFDREVLVWRLEALLRNRDRRWEPLLGYLRGDQAELKRFQLARRLAYLFDQYQIMRPDYLDAWQRGQLGTQEPAERWQRELWLELRRQLPGELHRGEAIARLAKILREVRRLPPGAPNRFFIFGVHTMPPLFLKVLTGLAAVSEVHFFLLSPCDCYWGDLESRSSLQRRRIAEPGGEPRLTEVPDFHPLLVSLGRQGAQFQEMLLDQLEVFQEGNCAFEKPGEGISPQLLHRLQSDLLQGFEVVPEGRAGESPGDDSLIICSCHSRLRELSVLKDYLLSWLYRDESLQLHEILVMAPDIQDYSNLIPAVFEDLQYTVADRSLRTKNRYYEIFLQLLDLFGGRYGWSEVLSILERPEVHPGFGIGAAELESIRHWVIGAGIRRGLSDRQCRRHGLPAEPIGTWRYGLERLLMGVISGSEEACDGVLPYSDIETGEAGPIGGLWRFVELLDRADSSFSRNRPLSEWSRRLGELCEELFGEPDDPELLSLSSILAGIEDDYGAWHREPVALPVLRHWLRGRAEGPSNGGFLNGRLTFCSMLPMRAIPFRIICLLGLNEADFPRRDLQLTFDLLGAGERPGDRSARADDRYQFLEAIISARERLYLSYVGQSIKDNQELPPSVVISELSDILKEHYGRADLCVRHCLQPYNPAYFEPGSSLFSYDQQSCAVAAALKGSTGSATDWESLLVEMTAEPIIELGELLEFYRQPQAFFVRRVLGISCRPGAEIPEENECFELDGLNAYLAERRLLESLVGDGEGTSELAGLQAELSWPLGNPGRLLYERRIPELRDFASRLRDSGLGPAVSDLRVFLEVSDCLVSGTLTGCRQAGQLYYRYGPLKGRDLLQGWVCHQVAARVRDCKLPTRLVCRDWTLDFAADAAAGPELEQLLADYQIGRSRPSRLLVEPAFAYAVQHLKNRNGSGRKNPLDAAGEVYLRSMEKGYEPEWKFLFRERPVAEILNEDFIAWCETVMVPLWERTGKQQQVRR